MCLIFSSSPIGLMEVFTLCIVAKPSIIATLIKGWEHNIFSFCSYVLRVVTYTFLPTPRPKVHIKHNMALLKVSKEIINVVLFLSPLFNPKSLFHFAQYKFTTRMLLWSHDLIGAQIWLWTQTLCNFLEFFKEKMWISCVQHHYDHLHHRIPLMR